MSEELALTVIFMLSFSLFNLLLLLWKINKMQSHLDNMLGHLDHMDAIGDRVIANVEKIIKEGRE